MGSTAFGMLVGAALALVLGRDAPAAIQAGVWLLFAFSFHLASKTLIDLVRARAWSGAALYTLHLFAFAQWPISVLSGRPDQSGYYWLGLLGLMVTLSGFLVSSRWQSRIVYRVCAHMTLIAAITALEGMLLSFTN